MLIAFPIGALDMDLLSRRKFLAENAMGVGSVALAWLLKQEKLLARPKNVPTETPHFDLAPKTRWNSAAPDKDSSIFCLLR